jgi:hypothetical protein
MRPLAALATLTIFTACGTADASPDTADAEAMLASGDAAQAPPTLVVYKTSTCGCCSGWVDHMREAGFTVDARDVPTNADLMRVKVDAGVPGAMATCHTALVGGYVVEGHVPASDVQTLLRERPAVAGIGVRGMPIGSPGMEVEGVTPQPYNVLAFDTQGQTHVFAKH